MLMTMLMRATGTAGVRAYRHGTRDIRAPLYIYARRRDFLRSA